MSETSRALGNPGEIEWPRGSGTRLKVSRVHFGIEARFEEYLEANRDAALERARARMSPEAYRERLRVAHEQDAGRAFAWENAPARQAAWTGEGFKRLAFFCIADLNPAWSRQQHDALFEDAEAIGELITIILQITLPHPNGSGAPGQQPEAPSSPSPSSSPS